MNYVYVYEGKYYTSWYDVKALFPTVSFPVEEELTDELLSQFEISRFVPSPTPPSTDDLKSERRAMRDRYLSATDYTQLPDAPLTSLVVDTYKAYRKYLREYTDSAKWWTADPKTIEEWESSSDTAWPCVVE